MAIPLYSRPITLTANLTDTAVNTSSLDDAKRLQFRQGLPYRRSPCRFVSTIRGAMSILEIMISMSILAMGMVGLISGMATIEAVNRESGQQQSVENVLLTLKTRLENSRWDKLRSVDAPWSYGRYLANDAVNILKPIADRKYDRTAPMTEGATDPLDCLLPKIPDGTKAGLGLLSKSSGLENLKVYVEWYRGTSYDVNGDGQVGTGEDGYFTNPNMAIVASRFASVSLSPRDAAFLPYLEVGQPSSITDQQATMLIRIIISYGNASKPTRRETIICRRNN